jgi:hypothetical protein
MQEPSKGGPLEWHADSGNAISTSFRLRHIGTGLYLAAMPTAAARLASLPSALAVASYSTYKAGPTAITMGAGASVGSSNGSSNGSGSGSGSGSSSAPAPVVTLPTQLSLRPGPIVEPAGDAPSTKVPGSGDDKGKADKAEKADKGGTPGDKLGDRLGYGRRSVSPGGGPASIARSAAYMASAAILRSGGSLVPKARSLEPALSAADKDKDKDKDRDSKEQAAATPEKTSTPARDAKGEVSPQRTSESLADAAARKVLKRPVPGGALSSAPGGVLVAGRAVAAAPTAAAASPAPALSVFTGSGPAGAASLSAYTAAAAPAPVQVPADRLSLGGNGKALPPPPPPLSPKKKSLVRSERGGGVSWARGVQAVCVFFAGVGGRAFHNGPSRSCSCQHQRRPFVVRALVRLVTAPPLRSTSVPNPCTGGLRRCQRPRVKGRPGAVQRARGPRATLRRLV